MLVPMSGQDGVLQRPAHARRGVVGLGVAPGTGGGGRGRAAQSGVAHEAHELIAPDGRPRHSRDGEEDDHPADIEAGQGVDIAPEGAAAGVGLAGLQHGAGAAAGPPQIEAGGAQDDGPARDDLDQNVQRCPDGAAEQAEGVQLLDRLGHAAIGGDAGDRGGVRIDEDGALGAVGPVDADAHGLIGAVRHQHVRRPAFARAGGGGQPLIGIGLLGAGRNLDHGAIDGVVDLVLEQIEAARQRQQHQERHHQHPGVEVPAPDGPIGAGHHVRRLGLERDGHQ